jgi:hypothetical protein
MRPFCATKEPPLADVEPDHAVACHARVPASGYYSAAVPDPEKISA